MGGEFVAGLVALLTVGINLYIAYNNRKKIMIEERDAARVAYLSLIQPLENRIAHLEKRIARLEKENDDLRKGVEILSAQLEQLGHQPAWRSKLDDED